MFHCNPSTSGRLVTCFVTCVAPNTSYFNDLDHYKCWCICEPMYRGPHRGPCIGSIYPTLLGFRGIQAIILSYSPSLTVRIHFRFPFLVALRDEDEFCLVDIASSHQCKVPNSLILYYKPMTKSAFFKMCGLQLIFWWNICILGSCALQVGWSIKATAAHVRNMSASVTFCCI